MKRFLKIIAGILGIVVLLVLLVATMTARSVLSDMDAAANKQLDPRPFPAAESVASIEVYRRQRNGSQEHKTVVVSQAKARDFLDRFRLLQHHSWRNTAFKEMSPIATVYLVDKDGNKLCAVRVNQSSLGSNCGFPKALNYPHVDLTTEENNFYQDFINVM